MFRLRRRRPKHVHDWQYCGRTLAGWGLVVCRSCGVADVY